MTGPPLLADRADALAAGADPDLLTERVLDAASLTFRNAARHPITPTVHRQAVPLPESPRLLLPHRPVLQVVEVLRPDETRPPRPVLGWRLDGDRLDLSRVRMPGWLTGGPPAALLVRWIAGYDSIPADVRACVARMAARACQPWPGASPVPRAVTLTVAERQVAHHYRQGGQR